MFVYGFCLFLLSFASAWDPPQYDGFKLVWKDDFAGPGGTLPDEAKWNIITGLLNVNNELEVYTRDTLNVQLSGGNTLQIVPWQNDQRWTSGRIESKYVLTPRNGRVTRIEAAIRFGSNDQTYKQGVWPALWMLGDSIRHGVNWPGCGEIDIMETVNGELLGHGTLHCDTFPGGICNEGTGISSSTPISSQGWHVWRLEIDLRPGSSGAQTITWFLDDVEFHRVSGANINREDVWSALTQRPLFLILNVAIGGNWPGYPNSRTSSGYGNMMEAAYVAHYESIAA